MPWFKVDDKLHSHVKAARAGVEALGLWVVCGSWCMDQLKDGFIPDYIALRLDTKARRHAAALVAAGLWHEDEEDGDQGWRFHDWDQYQPTREDVQEERRKARERMAKRRHSSDVVRANNEGTSGVVRIPRPDPTRTKSSTNSLGASGDERFDDFWRLYPRKDSGPAAARKAWEKATKTASPDDVISGLRLHLPGWAVKEKQFIPHASTWLNQQRWEAEMDQPAQLDRRPEGWR